jgi:hypothetical protein
VLVTNGEHNAAGYYRNRGTFQDAGVDRRREIVGHELLSKPRFGLDITDRKFLPNGAAQEQPDTTRQDAVNIFAGLTSRIEISALTIVVNAGGFSEPQVGSFWQALKPRRPEDDAWQVVAFFFCSH